MHDNYMHEACQNMHMPARAIVGVAPDNRFFGIHSTREPVTRLDVLLNWGELLKQRVR
jgi:hypothetical protein